MLKVGFLSVFIGFSAGYSFPANAWEGIAIHGKPKYSEGFTHLEYANKDAPKTGTLIIGSLGSFDTLNAFSTKGIAPLLLSQLVFQSLGQSTLDEPFSEYPELAESFSIAEDKLSLLVTLDKRAKFSDGQQVTAQDVKFSFELFRSDHVDAFYKSYWADIKDLEVIDSHSIRFVFSKYNPELPAIAMQLTILPKHIYGQGDFGKDFSDKVVGSGPYIVESFKRGSIIVYKRNQEFWAKGLPFYKGRYNFDQIVVKFYKDPTSQVEAFKKGEFDLYNCYSSKVWANDLVGEKFTNLKWIEKHEWKHNNNQGAQGFFFNLRNPLFQDIRVRKVIALAFDFEWTNSQLFYDQYAPNKSFFENSELKAEGLPEGEEKILLDTVAKNYPDFVPKEVFEQPMGYLGDKLPIKKRLKLATKLLKEAGYSYQNGKQIGPRGPLQFKFLVESDGMERVIEPFIQNLSKIGISVAIEQKEESVYQRRLQAREFDMIVLSIPQSQSPGNEQMDFWHSSSAEVKYSRNHYGLKNQAIDWMVEKVIYAKSRQELTIATRALDRLLYHQHIAVQNWHITYHRVGLWKKFSWIQNLPPFYNPMQWIEFMWFDEKLAQALQKAKENNRPL